MTQFNFLLEDYANNRKKCVELLASYLNQGALSFFFGAGVSKDLGLPGWYQLVDTMLIEVFSGEKLNPITNNDEAKRLSDRIKQKLGDADYINLVRKILYEKVDFDFTIAKKNLLIALTSLIVGKMRGSVNNILTYNFDSVIEWYLKINGLKVNVTTIDKIIKKNADVDIIHIHGYVPYDSTHGNLSESIIMSKEEFEDWLNQPSYEKNMMHDFFRRHIFLSIGLSAESLIDDVGVHLRALLKWYNDIRVRREQPFGIAFVSDCSDDQRNRLLKYGVIPCVIPIAELPDSLFSVAQTSIKD